MCTLKMFCACRTQNKFYENNLNFIRTTNCGMITTNNCMRIMNDFRIATNSCMKMMNDFWRAMNGGMIVTNDCMRMMNNWEWRMVIWSHCTTKVHQLMPFLFFVGFGVPYACAYAKLKQRVCLEMGALFCMWGISLQWRILMKSPQNFQPSLTKDKVSGTNNCF